MALETSKANDVTRDELREHQRSLEAHEARLKDWRDNMKADVAKQVAEQEKVLQVWSRAAMSGCSYWAGTLSGLLHESLTLSVRFMAGTLSDRA